uniref:Integrase catalytic domain-containing protein n=1 Tax=Trichuris muris TaxID=70415 RepID=A0A5S6QPY4_TRIMR
MVYWPGLDSQIENTVRQCSSCASAAKVPMKAAPCPWPQARTCWSRIHIDYAGPVDGRYLLVIVDSFSKWPEVFLTERITTSSTISCLRQTFARFGMPETIVSDNGTQFTALEFKDFCAENGIQQIFTPPGHPQSNGQAERFVDTLKRSLLKMKGEGPLTKLVDRFLLHYRSTPNPSFNYSKSPAEVFLGRPMRTANSLMLPTKQCKRPEPDGPRSSADAYRSRAFKPGDRVYVLNNQGTPKWIEGDVITRRGKVVYEVRMGEKICRRHINQIRGRSVISEARQRSPLTDMTIFEETSRQPLEESVAMQSEDVELEADGIQPCLSAKNSDAENHPTPKRPRRNCRPPVRLDPDPKRKSYY